MPSRAISFGGRFSIRSPLKVMRAFGDARIVEAEEAGDRAQRRGLAGAVGAEHRHDLAAGGTASDDALHGRDGAV